MIITNSTSQPRQIFRGACKIIVEEPFLRPKNKRLIALYDADTPRKFGPGTGKDRIIQ